MRGEELKPYEVDASTLHLWHLDEKAPPFKDGAPNGQNLLGLLNNAEAGISSLPDLGNCVSFNHDAGGVRGTGRLKGGILLAAPVLADGPSDNVPDSFMYAGSQGAFTYEAIVRFDVLPKDSGSNAMDIISMDGESSSRIFNLRVDSSGFLAFVPLSARGGALAAIPTTGPHAINTTDWFHVAVAYDGNDAASNNLKLYWTRLDAPQPSAHLLGRGTLARDLGVRGSDFAIGNEARGGGGNAESEPFRGVIDEVRISSVARDPTDFLFIPNAMRKKSGMSVGDSSIPHPLNLVISGVSLDEEALELLHHEAPLSLPPGRHRLSFDFGIPPEKLFDPVTLRYRLKGLDERWEESGRVMSMTCEVLDENNLAVSTAVFPINGASRGWQSSIDDSGFTARSEPLQVPASGRSIRITLSSGADDTTGTFVIDDLDLIMKSGGSDVVTIWKNSGFEQGERTDQPGGAPSGWLRGGSAPTIACMAQTTFGPSFAPGPSLALIDGDQTASGTWSSSQPLPQIPKEGVTLRLQWNEMFNVIGGSLHRATFTNVPPGNYEFEAIAASRNDVGLNSHVSLPFTIRAPYTARPWFWALVASSVVASLSLGVLMFFRQQAMRKIHQMRIQNALARDRARIARDMHDDLGTRITLLTINVSLAKRDLRRSPEDAERQLQHLGVSAHKLVTAMDDLVWAIDPSNDTLDSLGEHLLRLAQEIFQDSQIHCTVDIPHVLPKVQLTSDFRHHLSLAVKESLHNILRHAGPCEASLTVQTTEDRITVVVEDHGRGFDISSPEAGNGLANLMHRMADLSGTCDIRSEPGKGTRIILSSPLPSAS